MCERRAGADRRASSLPHATALPTVRSFALGVSLVRDLNRFETPAPLSPSPPTVTEANDAPPLFRAQFGQNYRSGQELQGGKRHDVRITLAARAFKMKAADQNERVAEWPFDSPRLSVRFG